MRCYGTLSLTVTSPVQSFTEPLSLSEVKKFLELPERSPTDEAEDAMLEGFIAGAREYAELFQNRDLVEKQYDLALDYFPCEIELRTPLVSVDLVQYTDSDEAEHALTEGDDYIVDLRRGLVMPAYGESWPSFTAWPSSAVLVQFTAGLSSTDVFWNDAGSRVKIGMKHLISAWFNGRLPFEPVPGSTDAVELPFTVTACLSAGAVPRVR
jgi:uncharacterized phiE125 gp8 family phage protein